VYSLSLILIPLSRILLSRPFRFIVGTDSIPTTVHEAAIAQQSPALTALVQGEISESRVGEARWGDVDKGTFLRFIQFVYTGDYSVPQSIVDGSDHYSYLLSQTDIEQEDTPREAIPSAVVDDWVNWGVSSKKDKKRKGTLVPKPTLALDPFSSLSYSPPKTQFNITNACACTISDDSGVLLAHASLYVLGKIGS
jgi:hypothetical protein